MADGGDVTDDINDSEADTMSFDQDYTGHNTTTTIATDRRCDTEEEDDDDDETTATATGATATADDDDEDDDNNSCDNDAGKRRRKKQRRSGRRGDDTLLITSGRDKKSMQFEQQLRNANQFRIGVQNSAASLNKLDEDCWSKELERDTPSPNLDESKKNWETRCIVVVVVVIASVAAAIFVFFLTGQSRGW